MPPWQPEAGYGEFEGDRRLSVQEIGLFQQWAKEGAIEGEEKELPPRPVWTAGWELGSPDLIVELPEPYELRAEGRDVYATFAIPLTTTNRHFVRAMEFHPRNRAVHHASVLVGQGKVPSRGAGSEAGGGSLGMDLPSSAQTPEGHFLSWQPGRSTYFSPSKAPWMLPKGGHLVVQLHLNPTGKRELIQPEIGFFFTDEPPSQALFKFRLESREFTIPAGASNFVVEESYRLPVDLHVLGVNPHAHYLGRDLYGYALLPDGRRAELIRIKNWDFAWQGDYRLKEPLKLPHGTVLHMRFTYDNSEQNPRNPFHPPKPAGYGMQTVDEMAELWIQVTASPEVLGTLAEDLKPSILRKNLATYRYRLRTNPADGGALTQLGATHLALGEINEALTYLRAAAQMDASLDEPHYYLGLVHRSRNELEAARSEFERAIALNPVSHKAYGNLGLIALQSGKADLAEAQFRQALKLNPDDALARKMLAELRKARKDSSPRSK